MYRSRASFERCIDVLRSSDDFMEDMESRLAAELAFLYVGRDYFPDSFEDMLARWNAIAVEAESRTQTLLPLFSQLVRAAILVKKGRRYHEARSMLMGLYEELRSSEDNFLFGAVSKSLGNCCTLLGDHDRASDFLGDAVSTFHRFDHPIFYAMAINDCAIVRKRSGDYTESCKLLKRASHMFKSLGIARGEMMAASNLATTLVRAGEWSSAFHYFDRAIRIRDELIQDNGDVAIDAGLNVLYEVNLEHLRAMRREFDVAIAGLDGIVEKTAESRTNAHEFCLANEFLGELHMEVGHPGKAREFLDTAKRVAKDVLPDGDVMTEVLRRSAQLFVQTKNYDEASAEALECVKLSKRIGDRYELGAAIRVLGQVHAAAGNARKARAAFEVAIHTLKSIHESYELMRTLIAFGEFLIEEGDTDAGIHLVEARQLCRKLDLNFFEARIEIFLSRVAAMNDSYEDARTHLTAAEALYENVHKSDQKQIKPLLTAASSDLDKLVMQSSMKSAEDLKTICKVYEEARFPMDDMKPDLAYRVAQTIGAESLFLIRRWKRGYDVPLAYNVPKSEAKETVRRLDRERKEHILGASDGPKMLTAFTGKMLFCVPIHNDNGYVLCAQFTEHGPLSPRQFEFLLASAEALERLAEDQVDAPRPIDNDLIGVEGSSRLAHPRGSFKDILTVDPEFIKLIHLAERAGASRAPILLEGETGVGKELFARAIHGVSQRSEGPFVAINAGGMPVGLMESQLFGHVKGAFTDAVTDRVGLVEAARGGTLFLDEVGEMGEEMQVKLLRLLENGEYRRLGDNDMRAADVRVISASNREIEKEVAQARFRRDLFYRLATIKLSIAPLRFRKGDIQLLIRHFLREAATWNGQPERRFQIDVKALEALELYEWPGNVRELHNEIVRAVSLIGESDMIRFGMLSEGIKDFIRGKRRDDGLLERSVEGYERKLILDALQKNDWNRLRTAEEVGIPRTTLLAKMKRLNIATR